MNKVIIFSPNRYSLYTTTVTAMLIQRGVQVSAIYVRRLLNPARALQELRRDGSRLLHKVWKKLLLRQAAYHSEKYETILDLRRRNNITTSDVEDFKRGYAIPVHYCSNLNDPAVVEGLKSYKPDLIVFTGGGLIRQAILENSGHGVVNCHMGVLPPYRGMDVVEWPILENHFDQVGITVHFMDKGVDTGDILQIQKVPLQLSEAISDLRNRMEPIMCQSLVDTCEQFLQGKIMRQLQTVPQGRQYFKMHPHLQELCGARLITFQNRTKEEHH